MSAQFGDARTMNDATPDRPTHDAGGVPLRLEYHTPVRPVPWQSEARMPFRVLAAILCLLGVFPCAALVYFGLSTGIWGLAVASLPLWWAAWLLGRIAFVGRL